MEKSMKTHCVFLQTWGWVNEGNFEFHRVIFTDQRVEKPRSFSSLCISPSLFWGQRHGGICRKCHVRHTHPQRDMKCSCVLTGYIVHSICLCMNPVKHYIKVQYQSKVWDWILILMTLFDTKAHDEMLLYCYVAPQSRGIRNTWQC